MKKMLYIVIGICVVLFILLIIICSIQRCFFTYGFKDKPRPILHIPTNVKTIIIKQISDSLFKEGKYNPPSHYTNDSCNYQRYHLENKPEEAACWPNPKAAHRCFRYYHFKNTPEELYLIDIYFGLNVYFVFNAEEIERDKTETISRSEEDKEYIYREEEKIRMRKRLKRTLLTDIVAKAREYGIPDSCIFNTYP